MEEDSIISKFADDTKVGRVVQNEDDRDVLQREIDNLVAWTNQWQMSFNKGKCKVLHIGKHNQKFNYRMGNQALETTLAEKDVGVLVTSDLKPTQQCARAAKRANSVLSQISRAFH